ncbi:MAG TPA: glycosyltransferase [Thermoanaerobaculia bacterium]
MTIQALWIGPSLSPMERLSLASFVSTGHAVHLYVYDEVERVPQGVTLRDANEILPASRIFRYREHDSVAGFANYFRYKLLAERGGWWIDMDVVCLRPFNFEEEYVFPSEMAHGKPIVGNCVLRAPAGAPVMTEASRICDSRDPATLMWGETGPRLCAELVQSFALERYVQPPSAFCPIPWYEWRKLIEPSADIRLPRDAYAVHLWNEMWRRGGVDKGRQYHPRSLYERLKANCL